jgi:hypothetical protein
MAFDLKILGKVRGIFMDLLPTNREDEQLQLSGQGDLLVAHGAAPYQEIVRQGKSFWVNTTVDVAAVTAIPTTAVLMALYNNENDGGRSLIIDQVWAMCTTDAAAGLKHFGIICCLGTVREAVPADAALAIKQCNGMGNTDTRVRTIISGTALPAGTGIAANWFPVGNSNNSAVASLPGYQLTADVNGRYIVPPGRYFAIHVLGSVNTSEFQTGIMWHEKVLLNG